MKKLTLPALSLICASPLFATINIVFETMNLYDHSNNLLNGTFAVVVDTSATSNIGDAGSAPTIGDTIAAGSYIGQNSDFYVWGVATSTDGYSMISAVGTIPAAISSGQALGFYFFESLDGGNNVIASTWWNGFTTSTIPTYSDTTFVVPDDGDAWNIVAYSPDFLGGDFNPTVDLGAANFVASNSMTPVPEPSQAALAFGLMAVGLVARRRRR